LAGDGGEGAVGIHQPERVGARVPRLRPGSEVARGPPGECDYPRWEDRDEPVEPDYGNAGGVRDGQDAPEQTIVEGGRGEDDGGKIEPGEVAAQHQPELRDGHDEAGDRRDRLRKEEQDRHGQLREVASQYLDAVQRLGEMVEVPRERVRHRLRLVVVVEAGQIAPAGIAAQLDEPGAELEAEEQPAE